MYFNNDSKTYQLKGECHYYVKLQLTRVFKCMGYKLRVKCHCYVERGEKITSYTKTSLHFALLLCIYESTTQKNILRL